MQMNRANGSREVRELEHRPCNHTFSETPFKSSNKKIRCIDPNSFALIGNDRLKDRTSLVFIVAKCNSTLGMSGCKGNDTEIEEFFQDTSIIHFYD